MIFQDHDIKSSIMCCSKDEEIEQNINITQDVDSGALTGSNIGIPDVQVREPSLLFISI